jgi:hypothetical protein
VPISRRLANAFAVGQAGGFSQAELESLAQEAAASGELVAAIEPLWRATLNPAPATAAHSGPSFLSALALFHDGTRDGSLTSDDLSRALQESAISFLRNVLFGGDPVTRTRDYKTVQKLRLLEEAMGRAGLSAYPYTVRALAIDHHDAWNVAHTVVSREQFQRRVLDASYDRPVLVKFGNTSCVHCQLMEALGSVRAVADKYDGVLDVIKVWWNDLEPDRSEMNALKVEQGVQFSPYFILYKDGVAYPAGYAFPDADGSGMEDFLADKV